jgi:hypothetical protein
MIRVPLLVGHVLEQLSHHPPSRSPKADNSTTTFKFTGSPMELPHAVRMQILELVTAREDEEIFKAWQDIC